MAGIMGAVALFQGCTAGGTLQRLHEPYRALPHSPQFTDDSGCIKAFQITL